MKKEIQKIFGLLTLLGLSSVSYGDIISVPAGDITTSTTWTTGNEYVLEGIVYIKNATLTIQPGVIVRGQPRTSADDFDPGTLVITRTAKISAVGTATSPIVFTTAALDSGANNVPLDTNMDGYFDRAVIDTVNNTLSSGAFLDDDPLGLNGGSPLPPTASVAYSNAQFSGGSTTLLAALTGGLIILGQAPTNVDNVIGNGFGGFLEGVSFVEGLSEVVPDTTYGGDYPLHNSGKLSYISIRHGGASLTPGNEINGLTLAGVGAGTQVDHIDIYVNADDGIEVFGGSVFLNYLNINFVEDDGFDVDQGWTGAAQFLFVLQHPNFGDKLGEWDGGDQDSENDGSGDNFQTANLKPLSNSVIANGTFVGRSGLTDDGLRMRAGYGGEVLNNIVVQSNNALVLSAETAIESDGFDCRSRAILGELQIRGNTFFGNNANTLSFTQTNPGDDVEGSFDTADTDFVNRTSNPGFKTFDVDADVNPVGLQSGQGGTPLAFASPQSLPNNAFFTTVTYRGAFTTSKLSDLWTNGWTTLNLRGILVSKGNQ